MPLQLSLYQQVSSPHSTQERVIFRGDGFGVELVIRAVAAVFRWGFFDKLDELQIDLHWFWLFIYQSRKLFDFYRFHLLFSNGIQKIYKITEKK